MASEPIPKQQEATGKPLEIVRTGPAPLRLVLSLVSYYVVILVLASGLLLYLLLHELDGATSARHLARALVFAKSGAAV